MSLEQLRAQAEEEETAKAEEPEAQDEPEPEEAEEAEPEEGSSEEEEGGEAEEEPSEDFELELGGEPEPGQQKPSPEDALVYKLTKQKAKAREYKTELEELKAEIAALKSGSYSKPKQNQQPGTNYPPVPVLYEDGIDTKEQYTQAYQKWMADCRAIDQRNSQADQQKTEYKRQMEEMTHNLAKRLGKFATEHKIKDDRVIAAAERATSEIDGATKIDGSLAYLLDSVGDGGERVAYYIGTNDAAMSKVKELLQQDNSGLKAIAHMTRLAEKLKPKHSAKTSKAPAPDTPLKGDGSSASAKTLQAKYDKTTDPKEMMNLRKKARELGVKLT